MDFDISILFALLKCELSGEKVDEKIKIQLSSELAEKLLPLASKLGVAQIITQTFISNGLLPENHPLIEKFKTYRMGAFYRYTQFEYERNRMYKALEDAKIPFIPLKGSVMAKFYPQPYMRISGDVDILIEPGNCERAISVLKDTLNYTLEQGTSLHDYQLLSPGGVHLELHHTLIEKESLPKSSELLSEIWKYTQKYEGWNFYTEMSPEIFMCYHIVHMAKHFLKGGCGLKMFIDMWLIKRNFSIDNTALKKMLEEIGLIDFFGCCSSLIEVWFGDEEHTSATKEMQNFVFSQNSDVCAEISEAVAFIKGEKNKKSYFSLFFLPRKSMEIIYPNVKRKPFLLPVYYIYRGLRIFDKRKKQRVDNAVSRAKSVDGKNIEGRIKFLKNIGIDTAIKEHRG